MDQLVNGIVASSVKDEEEIIFDPRDGFTPLTDPFEIMAVREGCFWIHRKTNRLLINWSDLMKKRRTYRDPPEYAKLTPRQIELYWKLREGNFVPFQAVSLILNVGSSQKAWEVCRAKGIPVYKFPPNDQLKVLSTDLILMVDSCQIDTEAENGIWAHDIGKSLMGSDRSAGRDKWARIKRLKKQRRERSAIWKASQSSGATTPSSKSDPADSSPSPSGVKTESLSPVATGTSADRQRE